MLEKPYWETNISDNPPIMQIVRMDNETLDWRYKGQEKSFNNVPILTDKKGRRFFRAYGKHYLDKFKEVEDTGIIEKLYRHKQTNRLYRIIRDFETVTKDWNNDGDIYALDVCYLELTVDNGYSPLTEIVTREELAEKYEAYEIK